MIYIHGGFSISFLVYEKKTEEISVRLERIWKDSQVKFETSKNIGD